MTKFIAMLTLLLMLLLSVAIEAQEEPTQEEIRRPVLGEAPGVKCLAPGNRESVTYDYMSPDGPDVDSERIKVVDNVMVGSDWGPSPSGNAYRCMGRCGFNCWGHPRTSRMYTKDCLTLDVCSREQDANGGGADKNCGDEFREAIGDTFFSLFNICKYRRGGHRHAASGLFEQ